jgi:hypothetical protein
MLHCLSQGHRPSTATTVCQGLSVPSSDVPSPDSSSSVPTFAYPAVCSTSCANRRRSVARAYSTTPDTTHTCSIAQGRCPLVSHVLRVITTSSTTSIACLRTSEPNFAFVKHISSPPLSPQNTVRPYDECVQTGSKTECRQHGGGSIVARQRGDRLSH